MSFGQLLKVCFERKILVIFTPKSREEHVRIREIDLFDMSDEDEWLANQMFMRNHECDIVTSVGIDDSNEMLLVMISEK